MTRVLRVKQARRAILESRGLLVRQDSRDPPVIQAFRARRAQLEDRVLWALWAQSRLQGPLARQVRPDLRAILVSKEPRARQVLLPRRLLAGPAPSLIPLTAKVCLELLSLLCGMGRFLLPLSRARVASST